MGYFDAILLAVLQGFTEFLPVSSSGHLVLVQQWRAGVGQVDHLYDVLLHLATALSVLVYLRRDVLALLKGIFGTRVSDKGLFAGQERRIAGWILIATIPTGLVGLALDRWLFSDLIRPDIVGSMLLVTGGVLWWGRKNGQNAARAMRTGDAVTLGLVQGLAVTPGLSRSGLTISAGLALGLNRDLAVRFSLLMSIPAILGATLLKALDAVKEPLPPLGPYAAGMLVAFGVGTLSIAIILRLVQRRQFHWFAWYVWPLGAAVILWYHWG